MKADTRKDPSEYNDQEIEFFDSPGVDRLFSICMATAEELAVANETIDTLKQVLISKKLISDKELEAFEPDVNVQKERSESHQRMIRRILSTIDAELTRLEFKNEDQAKRK